MWIYILCFWLNGKACFARERSSSRLWCSHLLDLTNTLFLVTIAVSSLRELLIAQLTSERLSTNMRSDVILNVWELCKRLRAFCAPKTPVHALSYSIQFIKGLPQLGRFFDPLLLFKWFGCFSYLVAWFLSHVFKAAFPHGIRDEQITVRIFILTRFFS